MKVDILNWKCSLENILWADLTVFLYAGNITFELTSVFTGMAGGIDYYHVVLAKHDSDGNHIDGENKTFKTISEVLRYITDNSPDSENFEMEITS